MQLTSGSQYQSRCNFVLPVDLVAGAYAVWELIDVEGYSYSTGTAQNLTSSPSQVRGNQFLINGDATISIPSGLPSNSDGTRYTISWALVFPDNQRFFLQEHINVFPPFYQKVGALDTVELIGNKAECRIVLPRVYNQMSFDVYRGNTLIQKNTTVEAGNQETSDGYMYLGLFDTANPNISPSLEPFTVIWKYKNSTDITHNSETASCFVITPTMLDAYSQVKQFLNKAYIDSGIDPGTEFDVLSIMNYLRMGMDMFNGAVVPTNFTMINAQGGIRAFWLNYSMVYAARSQYLAEGMKAFQYSGQVVTLDVDRTTYWEGIASALEAQINDQVTNFKSQVYNKGITGGDGSIRNMSAVNVGAIGIGLSIVSPVRSYGYGPGNPGPRF